MTDLKESKMFKNLWMVLIFVATAWPILVINRGIDFKDSGYYLSNYSHILKYPDRFGIGIYLSSYVGGLIYSLLPSYHLVVLKILNAILNGFSITFAFLVLKEYFNKNALSFLIMLGSMILSGFPLTLSYNTFSVFFLSLSVFMLHKWMYSKKWYLLVLLGIIIGFSVFFRLPNLLFAILYFSVLWNDVLSERKKNIIKDSVGMLIGGIIGLLVGFSLVVYNIGISNLGKGAEGYISLAGESDNRHGIIGMLKTIGSQLYWANFYQVYYIIFTAFFLLLLCIFVYKWKNDSKDTYRKLIWTTIALTSVTSVVLTYLKFNTKFAVFAMCAVVIFPVLIFSTLYYRKKDVNFSTILLAILSIAVAICFGTDNGINQHIIIFFWLMPCAMLVSYYLLKKCMERQVFGFFDTITLSLCIIVVVNTFSSVIFNIVKLTITEQYGEPSYMSAKYIPNNECLAGTKTTREKAATIDGIVEFMNKEEYKDKKVLAMNNIPIIYALIDNENVLETSFWPDLESCSINKIKSKLEDAKNNNDLPVVIIFNLSMNGDVLTEESEKLTYVKSFCEDMNYRVAEEADCDGKKIYTILVP